MNRRKPLIKLYEAQRCRDCHKRIHSFGEKTEHADFSWQETGELSIEIQGDLSATARYFPSEETIKETAERLARRPLSRSEIEDIHTLAETKKPISRSDSAILEGVQNGETNDRV